jgi:serine/threonine-protein kinase
MSKQRRRRYSESANRARGNDVVSSTHAVNDGSEPSSAASQTRPSLTSAPGVEAAQPASQLTAAATGPQPLALEDIPLRPSSDGMPAVTLHRKQCPTCRERYPADFRVCPRDATELEEASDAESDPLLGAVLGDAYQVLRVIGEGAMGRVYEARHTRLFSKHFAIKVLHGDLTRQPEVVGRFLREAEATSALHHPNIVGVLDVNRVPDGRPYIVAELLEGDQLGDYLERHGKLAWRDAIAICRPICRALMAAHDKDIVHRDIKPENVFLVGEASEPAARTVKVLDFGISRVGDAAASITKTGMVMGTPSYMPPEQARGARVDHRADIYAVGAILYEAVTGKRPFDDNDPIATLAAVLTQDPPRPCSFDPSLPPALELVIQKAMAKEPSERYQSMGELERALAAFDAEAPQPSAADDGALPQVGVQTAQLGFWGSHGAPEQARANLSALSIAAAVCALLGTIDVSTSLVRWSRGGAPLTAAEIVLATLGSVGLLATPCLAWARYLRTRVWPSTPRVLDVEARTKRVLAASLVTYGAGSLLVHVLAGAFRSSASGLAWAGWSVLVFLAAAAIGGTAAWSAFRSRKSE